MQTSSSVPETLVRCTDELIFLFIIILWEGRMRGEKTNSKESECTGASVFREKSNDACPVIIASEMSQYPGIMTIEVEQHRI